MYQNPVALTRGTLASPRSSLDLRKELVFHVLGDAIPVNVHQSTLERVEVVTHEDDSVGIVPTDSVVRAHRPDPLQVGPSVDADVVEPLPDGRADVLELGQIARRRFSIPHAMSVTAAC